MAIQWKGILKDPSDLKHVNVRQYQEMKTERVDAMRAMSALMIPVFFGLILLRSRYDGALSSLLLWDGIGLLGVFVVMVFHEYLHALTFDRSETVEIWMYHFSMLTHCTQEMNAREMIRTFLFPNLCITLPASLIMIAAVALGVTGLPAKVIGFVGLILVIGAYDDLCKASYLQRHQSQIKKVRLSGMKFYYR